MQDFPEKGGPAPRARFAPSGKIPDLGAPALHLPH